jgi:hypothetical protein
LQAILLGLLRDAKGRAVLQAGKGQLWAGRDGSSAIEKIADTEREVVDD